MKALELLLGLLRPLALGGARAPTWQVAHRLATLAGRHTLADPIVDSGLDHRAGTLSDDVLVQADRLDPAARIALEDRQRDEAGQ
jgi:hypothetical protein